MPENMVYESLKGLSFFSEFSDEVLRGIAKHAYIHKHPKEDILLYENDINNNIYFLISGHIKVYKVDRFDNEIFLYDIVEDSMISEITDFEETSIQCFSNMEFTEDSEVLVLEKEHFEQYYKNNIHILNKLFKEFVRKRKQLQCLINREIVFDGTAKVAFMLANNLELYNKLKKQEVAYRLNIQPETLSRIMKKLVRKNLVEVNSNKVTILDLDAIKEIYE